MEKENRKDDLSAYSEYDKLVYFRWKALIRSKEYRDFYKTADIKKLISDISDIECEIDCTEPCYVPELSAAEYTETQSDLQEEKERLEEQIGNILIEARDRFGLIAADLEDLEPVDKLINELQISFTGYLSAMPEQNYQKRFFKKIALQEIEYRGGSLYTKETGGKSRKFYPHKGQEMLSIVTNLPFPFIMDVFKEYLSKQKNMPLIKKRTDRKDFAKWEEALRAWDIQQKTRNLYKTAQIMELDKNENRNNQPYTVEELRTLVKKKLQVANELIALAGQGKFKSL